MKRPAKLALAFSCALMPFYYSGLLSSAYGDIVIDGVLASVDGKPITLHDISSRLTPPRSLTMKEAYNDSEARALLDAVIMEKLIVAEGESRRIAISDEDIERYIDAVAQRNDMSRPEFEQALTREKTTLSAYKDRVRVEITKSKIISSYIQNSIGVTESQIREYIEKHPELNSGGSTISLSHIVVSRSNRSSDEAKARIEEARNSIDSGKEFSDVAKEFSDAPDASDGGSLGEMKEEDLSHEIFEAVLSLKDGEISETVENDLGLHIFKVNGRTKRDNKPSDEVMAKARSILEQEQAERRVATYFTSEIYKLHHVDKKV